MINFNINIYILALQKYLSPSVFINSFLISPTEYVDVLKTFKRDIKKLDYYIEKQYFKNNVLKKQIIEFIAKNNRKISLKSITNIFRIDEDSLVSFLNYNIKKNIFLAPFIYSQSILSDELIKKTEKISKNNILLKKSKLFKGNNKNTELLIEQSNSMSIEEISFFWEVPPALIVSELQFNRKGGFWENENIRTNAPFFLNKIGNKYSYEELFFIIENFSNLSPCKLSNILHTTTNNIKTLISKLQFLLNYFSKMELKEIIVSKCIYKNVKYWPIIEQVKYMKKENSSFIFNYNFDSLFTYGDNNELNIFFDKIFENFTYKQKLYNNFENKIVILETKCKKYTGYLYREDSKCIILKYDSGKTQNFQKKDILYLKAIK